MRRPTQAGDLLAFAGQFELAQPNAPVAVVVAQQGQAAAPGRDCTGRRAVRTSRPALRPSGTKAFAASAIRAGTLGRQRLGVVAGLERDFALRVDEMQERPIAVGDRLVGLPVDASDPLPRPAGWALATAGRMRFGPCVIWRPLTYRCSGDLGHLHDQPSRRLTDAVTRPVVGRDAGQEAVLRQRRTRRLPNPARRD